MSPTVNNSPMEETAIRLAQVRELMGDAARKSGRTAEQIELVAVSKTHAAEKVQEARAKIPLLPSRLRWHFIGHLQKNKIRHALSLFELFHGIDSLALAQDMERIAEQEGMRPRVLLEVNVAGEASKHGFSPETLRRDLEAALSLGRLTIEGLMTLPPFAPEAEASRQYFIALRKLRDQLEAEFDVRLPQLSMGMSGDFPIAIEEGATLVRVGTAIFGERPRPKRE